MSDRPPERNEFLTARADGPSSSWWRYHDEDGAQVSSREPASA
ncbi:MAG: hypothetical protein JWQ81_5399 [Amycolatopsis sp.]|jgi:hypothetical protein|nr:hypothetical protein [Amycolatopsis sp.]